MKDIIFVCVTFSIIIIDLFVVQLYITGVQLLLEKNRLWIFFFLIWAGIVLVQTVFYSWLPGRMGAEISYLDGGIVLEDGALIRNCGLIILVHDMGIGLALLKHFWNVIRRKEKFQAKLFWTELLIGILLCFVAVLLIRNEYVVNFEGGELFAKIVTALLAAAGAGVVLAGIKMYFSEKKSTEKKSIEKQSADAAGEPGKASSGTAGGHMEKRLCYCSSCARYFIISPDKACPKCQGKLISSVVTEEEWNRSSAEQKEAFKKSIAAMSCAAAEGQNKSTSQKAGQPQEVRQPQDTSTAQKEKALKKSDKPKSKSILGALFFILVVGVLVFLNFRPYDGACTDYESAGKKVYKQISQYDSDVYVSYHSDHYNRIIGINDDINNIMKAACQNNGNPQEGDHLAMNATWTGGEYAAVEQKDGTHNLNIQLEMSYETTKEQEKELKDKVDAVLAKLDLDGASEYEKVRAIYNYICSNVVYDYDHLNDNSYRLQYTAYAAAINGTAVCSGVADLFYYMATAAGLEARITVNDIHAWNIVKVDGKYYYLDPTWDLGINESEYRYFLKGESDFVDIMNGPEHAAHRESVMAGFLVGPKHPLTNIEKEYDISENAYGI